MSDQSILTTWTERKADELGFWEQWLRTKGREWPEDFLDRLDPTAEINECRIVEHIVGMPDEFVSILDVGAGPLTSLGKTLPGKKIAITATDPLAEQYNRIIDALGIAPPVRSIACEGESLLALFKPETFDIVYARNALDHSHNPLLVIRNMVTLLRANGLVFLRHFNNEAERQANQGLHLWNFEIRKQSVVIWNNDQEIDLESSLGEKTRVIGYREGSNADNAHWVVAEITKAQ